MSLTETIGHTVYRRPRYPTYRASGIDWLGDIPSHWKLKRLRMLARLNPSKQEIRGIPSEHHATFLPMELIGEDGALTLTETRAIGDVQNGYTYFRDGDVLVAKITPCFENGKGGLCRGLLNGIGFGTTEIHVVRVRAELDERFLYYVTRTDEFRKLGEASMYGAAGQQRVSEEFIKDFPVAYPDTEEQRAIVEFLDRETARIDALIAKKERLIELLQEKRTALISHAVTKGLDPTVPTRDSGIPWIGRIPAHWEVTRLGWISHSLQTGPFGSQLHADEYVDGGTPVINPSHLSEAGIQPDPKISVSAATAIRLRRHWLQPGDIVFARRGDLGRCSLVQGGQSGWICGTGSLRVRLNQQVVDSNYLIRYLSNDGIASWLSLQSVGSTMDNLNTSILARLPIVLPPRSEQQAIYQWIDAKIEQVSSLIAKVSDHVGLLQEHRTALISAAVTGKIDVRGEV